MGDDGPTQDKRSPEEGPETDRGHRRDRESALRSLCALALRVGSCCCPSLTPPPLPFFDCQVLFTAVCAFLAIGCEIGLPMLYEHMVHRMKNFVASHEDL